MSTVKYLNSNKSYPLVNGEWVSLDDNQGESAQVEIPELVEVLQEGGEKIPIPQKIDFHLSVLLSGVVYDTTIVKIALVVEDYSEMGENNEPIFYPLRETRQIFEVKYNGTQYLEVKGSAVVLGKYEYSGEGVICLRKIEPHVFVDKADLSIQEVIGIFKFLSPDEV